MISIRTSKYRYGCVDCVPRRRVRRLARLRVRAGRTLSVSSQAMAPCPTSPKLSSAGASIADKFFHLDWSVAPGRAGMSRITGYVYNATMGRPRRTSS